jgi:hypothetical protein
MLCLYVVTRSLRLIPRHDRVGLGAFTRRVPTSALPSYEVADESCRCNAFI